MAKKLALYKETKSEHNNDFVMRDNEASVWITIDNLSIFIARNRMFGNGRGDSVGIYAYRRHDEMGKELAEFTVKNPKTSRGPRP